MNDQTSRYTRATGDVFFSNDPVTVFDADVISFLKEQATSSGRKRSRLCAHSSPDATHHAMLIVMRRDSVLGPHRHAAKCETLTVIEGDADALLFNDSGSITHCYRMVPPQNDGPFGYYMPTGVYHMLRLRSEWFVYIETTEGPFTSDGMELADWSPKPDETEAWTEWLQQCDEAIGNLKAE